MEFELLDRPDDERQIGDFESMGTYEDMFNVAEKDFWVLFRIVNWLEGLSEDTVRTAISVLAENGFTTESDELAFWLKGKPK
jgi:hypothetical protein